MHLEDPDLDQRLSRFEAKLDRFSLALHQWQQTEKHSSPDVNEHMQRLEATLEREAAALRRMHEEPLKQLEAQAAHLREICAAASNSVNGLDQAESRLAAVQADVQFHLNELSRNLQAVVADLRAGASAAVATSGSTADWPLDQVAHLHHELRRTTIPAEGVASPEPPPRAPEAPRTLASGARLLGGAQDERETWSRGRLWLIAGAVAATALVFGFGRWIDVKLDDAAARATAAEERAVAATQLANREVAVARQKADQQIAETRQSAQRAEVIGTILAAPDLVRFNLVGGAGAERSSAQVLWSRTRGLVLSASRLPAPAPDTTYQLWLMSGAGPVSAGVVVPDATGRATLVTDAPPQVVGVVVGAEVTVEPGGGQPAPSGRVLLTRPLQ